MKRLYLYQEFIIRLVHIGLVPVIELQVANLSRVGMYLSCSWSEQFVDEVMS